MMMFGFLIVAFIGGVIVDRFVLQGFIDKMKEKLKAYL